MILPFRLSSNQSVLNIFSWPLLAVAPAAHMTTRLSELNTTSGFQPLPVAMPTSVSNMSQMSTWSATMMGSMASHSRSSNGLSSQSTLPHITSAPSGLSSMLQPDR